MSIFVHFTMKILSRLLFQNSYLSVSHLLQVLKYSVKYAYGHFHFSFKQLSEKEVLVAVTKVSVWWILAYKTKCMNLILSVALWNQDSIANNQTNEDEIDLVLQGTLSSRWTRRLVRLVALWIFMSEDWCSINCSVVT